MANVLIFVIDDWQWHCWENFLCFVVKASIMVVRKLQSTSQIISNQLIFLLGALKPQNEMYMLELGYDFGYHDAIYQINWRSGMCHSAILYMSVRPQSTQIQLFSFSDRGGGGMETKSSLGGAARWNNCELIFHSWIWLLRDKVWSESYSSNIGVLLSHMLLPTLIFLLLKVPF